MKNETKNTLAYFINLSFFLYFIILIVERVLSVVISLNKGIKLYADGFNGFTYTLVLASIAVFVIYLVVKCRNNIKALFHKPNGDMKFNHLCIASGILLLSGMVHTEYTIPVIQFISYGMLIIGILLQVIINSKSEGNKVLHWLSFTYLVSFSMAVPVMYRSFIEHHTLFHVFEGISSILLVAVFTYLLLMIFKQKDDLFVVWPISITVILDTVLIVMRWNEEINVFVMIFVILSLVIFIIGFIYKRKKIIA